MFHHDSNKSALNRRTVLAVGLGTAVLGIAPQLRAQDAFPNRPIRILVGAGAGGSSDTTARLVGAELAKVLGQPVIIDNKPGASGTISMQQMVRAPADGHTLVWVGNSVMAISPFLYKEPGYDVKTVIPVSLASTSSFVIMASPEFKDLKQLIAYGKANPGKLNFGSNGVNGSLHLLAELLKTEADFDAVHVPFKGGAESAAAAMGGQIQFFFDALSSNLALARSGKLNALAVTGSRREKSLPDTPTMAELGLPSMTTDVFFGLVAPPATPTPVVNKLADAMKTVLAMPALREALSATGNEAQSSTPAEFRAQVDKEAARFSGLIKAKGVQPK